MPSKIADLIATVKVELDEATVEQIKRMLRRTEESLADLRARVEKLECRNNKRKDRTCPPPSSL